MAHALLMGKYKGTESVGAEFPRVLELLENCEFVKKQNIMDNNGHGSLKMIEFYILCKKKKSSFDTVFT